MIEETLQSIIKQNYQNWEAIVVDDGSNDTTDQLFNRLSKLEKRIRYIKRSRNPKGAPTCRNIGLQQAKGEYVLFLDSDDLMKEYCLESRVDAFLKNPGEDFIVFQTVLFNEGFSEEKFYWNISTDESDLDRFLRLDAIWPICGPIYKTEILKAVNGFNESLDFWQDYDLHLRALLLQFKYKKFLNLAPDIYIRRHNKDSISQAIPFATDKVILKKRTDFFLAIVSFINERNLKITKIQKKILWGVLFYFSTSFLTIHNDRNEFSKYWKRSNKDLNIKYFPQLFSLSLAYIMYCRKYTIYCIKLGNIYRTIFKNYIADPDVMKKTNAGTVRFDMAQNSTSCYYR